MVQERFSIDGAHIASSCSVSGIIRDGIFSTTSAGNAARAFSRLASLQERARDPVSQSAGSFAHLAPDIHAEKAQAEAAPWKSRMEMAWEDVPLADAEDNEIEAWLKKWDSMTNEEV